MSFPIGIPNFATAVRSGSIRANSCEPGSQDNNSVLRKGSHPTPPSAFPASAGPTAGCSPTPGRDCETLMRREIIASTQRSERLVRSIHCALHNNRRRVNRTAVGGASDPDAAEMRHQPPMRPSDISLWLRSNRGIAALQHEICMTAPPPDRSRQRFEDHPSSASALRILAFHRNLRRRPKPCLMFGNGATARVHAPAASHPCNTRCAPGLQRARRRRPGRARRLRQRVAILGARTTVSGLRSRRHPRWRPRSSRRPARAAFPRPP